MYEDYFHLTEKPFSLLPDPAFLYLSKSHRMAMTMLEYGIESQAAISVITGEVGSGKTTLIRRLIGQIQETVHVALINHTQEKFNDLLTWIAFEFGLKTGKKGNALFQVLLEYFLEQHGKGIRSVLIIDEAQHLSATTLEGLRLVSNINVDKKLILQLILVGQPELLDTMRLPKMRQLAQRVSVDCHLVPLTRDETRRYISHRLAVAGGDSELFEDTACDAIYNYSGGIPRLINTLCDMSLVYAFAEERRRIDADLVATVAKDKQKGGILPINSEVEEPQVQETNTWRTSTW